MPTIASKAALMEVLDAHASGIRAFGVSRLGIFGSFVRDAARAESDVDLLVDFAPGRKTLKNAVGLSRFLQDLLGRKVELVTPGSLNRFTGKYILEEVEYVPLAA